MLRVCERFGINPAAGLDQLLALSPDAVRTLLAYEMIRTAEDRTRAI